ncbi:MAG: S-methyl-5-thioribose-1-phosphate isomerase [Verrucomicrobia bacterium]|nr:S-methyl-5-thioribose-1-phosphate isomerase [Verrucomicrobiota bacterium]
MADIPIPKNRLNLPETIWWDEGELFLLDQTQLPLAVVGERQDTIEQVSDSIKALKVRGAPAIGVAGAYGLLVGIKNDRQLPVGDFMARVESQAAWLGEARPTAVNLKWGLKRMVEFAKAQTAASSRELYDLLVEEAIRIHDEDRELCRMVGVHGAELIKPGNGVLTHCNAGSLATSEFGTATSPMYVAHQNKVPFKVYADETRPLLQGARLTSWELQQAGIDVTLITDNMAAHLMSQGLIDIVITGTDRTAANGDVANKIGTMGVAILAKHFGIPFYVALPYSTIDFDMPDGKGIPIEERDPEEVTHFGMRRTAPENIQVLSPAFDVTPNELVAGLITERGIIRPPFKENLLREYATKGA